MTPNRTIGIVGLGLMGTAFTVRLLEHGWRVVVWNRSRDKAEALEAQGAVWADNPFAVCDRVIVSLYTSEVSGAVLRSMQSDFRRGQTIIDTTTGEPAQSIEIARWLREEHGIVYLDAPVSGSSEQTRRGEAVVMASGERADFAANADLWPLLGGAGVFYCGSAGAAAKMKLVTNLVLGLNRAVLAEGLAFAEAIGVDAGAALAVLRGSNAYSKAMDVKGRKMLDRDYTVQARLSQHLKDVRLMLAETKIPLPLTAAHGALLEEAERRGLGELDNSAVIEVLRP